MGSGSPVALGESGACEGSGEFWAAWTSALTDKFWVGTGDCWNFAPPFFSGEFWASIAGFVCPHLMLFFLRCGLDALCSSPVSGAGGRVGEDFTLFVRFCTLFILIGLGPSFTLWLACSVVSAALYFWDHSSVCLGHEF